MASHQTLYLGLGFLVVLAFFGVGLIMFAAAFRALTGLAHLKRLEDISHSLKEIEKRLASQNKLD